MEMSDDGAAMLVALEGSRADMYHDDVGLPTIGVGHLLTRSELSSGKLKIGGILFPWGEGLSPAGIRSLVEQDTTATAAAVSRLVTVPLTQPQFDALVSLVFNIGEHAFADSTLLKLLNQGNYLAVPAQMRRWIHSKGMVLPKLQRRRATEIGRWNAGEPV